MAGQRHQARQHAGQERRVRVSRERRGGSSPKGRSSVKAPVQNEKRARKSPRAEDAERREERKENLVALAIFFGILIVIGFLGTKGFGVFKGAEEARVDVQEPVVLARQLVNDDFFWGEANASVVVVEFCDVLSPYCKAFHEREFPRLKEEFIDSGVVRWVFRDFPLQELRPLAVEASSALECAREQGLFEQYLALLFAKQKEASSSRDAAVFFRLAREIDGMDGELFDECLSSRKLEREVLFDRSEGLRFGVQVVPFFFVHNETILGEASFAVFSDAINRAKDR
ncbi:hypothetical protein D6783_04315 [Candidatus Woesearchaeota archaeon]|nr:MAG: hypothetical protein D6783_04315 [Candidatus Woesearchaeota archaeon]